MPAMRHASLIVDVTTRCNARCPYCRWGDGRTGERSDPDVARATRGLDAEQLERVLAHLAGIALVWWGLSGVG